MNKKNSLTRRELIKSGAAFSALFSFAPSIARNYTSHTEVLDTSGMLENPTLIKINANENPFGPSEKVKAAMKAAVDNTWRYSGEKAKEFVGLVSTAEGVKTENILLGAGSTELLRSAALYFGLNGGTIIASDQGYQSLVRDASNVGATIEKVPLTKDYKEDLAALKAKITPATKLIYISNPTNPLGTILDPAEFKAFCAEVSPKVPIFVDEAYIDYVDDPAKYSMIQCVREGMNVIVARTLSKVQGMAGARVGYMVGLADTLKSLSKYCSAGNAISAASIHGACACYNDMEFYNYVRKMNQASKDYLYAELKKMGLEYVPSVTNFVIFPITMDSKEFGEKMKAKGIVISPRNFYDKNWCRVSIGTMDEMRAFVAAYKEVLPPAVAPFEKQTKKPKKA